MTEVIRILCVDDHPVVRGGLEQFIEEQQGLTVVATAATGEEALDLYRQHRPDVTLMDLQLPGISGLEAIRVIRSEDEQARIIVLTMYQGDEDIARALDAGAVTYLLKDTLSHELLRTIRMVHDGERPLPPNVAARLASRGTDSVLSPRELQIVELIARGMRNKEIGADSNIAEETVHQHLKNIFSKLKVHDRSAVVATAVRRGMIHLR